MVATALAARSSPPTAKAPRSHVRSFKKRCTDGMVKSTTTAIAKRTLTHRVGRLCHHGLKVHHGSSAGGGRDMAAA